MKSTVSLLAFLLFMCINVLAQKGKKAKVEEVKPICEGLSFADKPVVAISTFKMGASGSTQAAGTGLSDMMMNAMLNSGCFRVVERERMNDILKEQGLGISGAGDEATFAQIGKQLGAQLLVMGTITEFTENESGGGGAGGGLLRGTRLGAVVGGVGAKTAHLGFTLRFVNPTTSEVLDMKSFDKKRTAVGVAGGGLFGGGLAAGAFYSSKSMQDNIEEALIEAVEFMSKNKNSYLEAVAGSKATTEVKVTRESCALLQQVRRLKIMVMIPEEHLAGAGSNYDPNRKQIDINVNPNRNNNTDFGNTGVNNNNNNNGSSNNSSNSGIDAINSARAMFRPPDPAGETEIMKKFLEFGGFDLVDSKQFEKLRNDKEYADAFENASIASKIGSKFGADIILVGEAFSEYSKSGNGMSSCRARVEVKAVMTSNARILAADGLHGAGLDVSEVIAGKTALRNAGSKVANYFLTQLCAKADDIGADLGSKQTKTTATTTEANEAELRFSNTDFTKATALGKIFGSITEVSKSERISFANKVAVYNVVYKGSIDKLLEKLSANKAGIKLDVKSIDGNKVEIEVK